MPGDFPVARTLPRLSVPPAASKAAEPPAGPRSFLPSVGGSPVGAGLWLWDAYYVIGAVVVAAAVLARAHTPAAGALAVGGVATLLLWYWVAERPAIHAGRQDRVGWVYVAGMLIILAGATWAVPESAFALFIACPMAFMALPFRQALVAVLLLNLTPLGIAALHGPGRLTASAPTVVLGVSFAVLAGTYLDRTIRINEERARLIADLRASRAEVQRLSHQAGVDAERARLAAEIHDTLAQGFTSVITLAQAAQASLPHDPDRARHHLELTIATSRENLAEARAFIAALAPIALDAGSLTDALRHLVDRFRATGQTPVTFSATGSPRKLPTATEVVVLRTAQEALANVRRHANASTAHVQLAYTAAAVTLTVTDDGAGFVTGARGGYGLTGMAARATQVGAHLDVQSQPGHGTTVTLQLGA